jgi:radical SAM protein with 4Fe4S-binding SPASM domain
MKTFKKIYIEITNACNLSCGFCPKTARPAEYMSKKLFEEILNKIKGSTQYVYFHVMGEPLMHPDIGTFLDISQHQGYWVNLTTNGTFIDSVGPSILAKPALRQMNFSLHCFEANMNNYPIDEYLDKVFHFIHEANKQRQIYFSLRLWNASKDSDNTHVFGRIEKEFALDFALKDHPIPFNGIPIADNVYLNQSPPFEWPDINRTDIDDEGFCYGLRDQVAILVDGTVVPCCLDAEGTINLGNIKNQTMDEIIQSPRARDIYNGFSRREVVEPLCRKCGYRIRFSS